MTPNRSCLYSVVPSKKKCPARNARPEMPGPKTPDKILQLFMAILNAHQFAVNYSEFICYFTML